MNTKKIIIVAGVLYLLSRLASGASPPKTIMPVFPTNPAPSLTFAQAQINLENAQKALSNAMAAAVSPYQKQVYDTPYGAVEAYRAANDALRQAQSAFLQTPLGSSLSAAVKQAFADISYLNKTSIPAQGAIIVTENAMGKPDFSGFIGPRTTVSNDILADISAGRFMVKSGSLMLNGITFNGDSKGWAYV